MCGKLAGYYPVVGWLRKACSYTMRRSEVENWSDKVGEGTKTRMQVILEQM